jgi:hypothetical protein
LGKKEKSESPIKKREESRAETGNRDSILLIKYRNWMRGSLGKNRPRANPADKRAITQNAKGKAKYSPTFFMGTPV